MTCRVNYLQVGFNQNGRHGGGESSSIIISIGSGSLQNNNSNHNNFSGTKIDRSVKKPFLKKGRLVSLQLINTHDYFILCYYIYIMRSHVGQF